MNRACAAQINEFVHLDRQIIEVYTVELAWPPLTALKPGVNGEDGLLYFDVNSALLGSSDCRHLAQPYGLPCNIAVRNVEVKVANAALCGDGKGIFAWSGCDHAQDPFGTVNGQISTPEMLQKPLAPLVVRKGETIQSKCIEVYGEPWETYVPAMRVANDPVHSYLVRGAIYVAERPLQDANGRPILGAPHKRFKRKLGKAAKPTRPDGHDDAEAAPVPFRGCADPVLRAIGYGGAATHVSAVPLPDDLTQPLADDHVFLFVRATKLYSRSTFESKVELEDTAAAVRRMLLCVIHAMLRGTENMVHDLEDVRLKQPRVRHMRPAAPPVSPPPSLPAPCVIPACTRQICTRSWWPSPTRHPNVAPLPAMPRTGRAAAPRIQVAIKVAHRQMRPLLHENPGPQHASHARRAQGWRRHRGLL